MRHQFGKTIVVALGGSVVFPKEIDVQLLKKLRTYFKRWSKKKKFVVVVGGGRLSRIVIEAASGVVRLPDEEKDWLGIHATRLNAHLVQSVLWDIADPVVIHERFRLKKLTRPVTLAAGWKPGSSTDHVAVQLAADFGAKEVVIVGKPDYVYPVRSRARASRPGGALGRATSNGVYDHQFNIANPFHVISWRNYKKLIPATWTPGGHAPVDPVAARLAEREGIAAIVVGGKNLKNLDNLLNGQKFRGTIIEQTS